MRRKIEDLDMVQLNFALTVSEYDEVVDVLLDFGAEETDEGRLQHSTPAFMDIIHNT